MPLAVVFLVALFLVPVPAAALDFLLVTNVVLSLALLLRAVLVRGRIELAAFPALLLISTLFRLGLNVSSTRLILLRGDEGSDVAGRVIETFGTFVVGGDFVVGAIVFGVIALVNFIVITRGAARVAEVSARFSLDALPGRQLAIDADQRNGSISSAEADRRRDELSRESQFFGSMDGAMRFVQGDAIATLVIVVINALGGMILGASRGLDLATSMQTFGVLAIGDGLVSIIPSLLVSVSAGIVVTNSSGRDRRSVGESLPEMFADPRALALSGLVVVFMGFIPGFPLLPFSFTGLALVGLALRSGDPARRVSFRDAAGMRSRFGEIFREPPLVGLEAASTSESHFAPIRVEIPTSESGTSIVDVAALQRELDSQRDELFRRRGVRLPAVTVSETPGLSSRQYRVRVRERIVRSNELPESGIFVPLSRAALSTFGFEVVAQASHPLTPQSAAWVRQDGNAVQILKELEIESIDLTEYLALETVGAALSVIEELFGVDEVRGRVEELRRDHPHVVSE
ncbi:MAG: FHIPEP family type III secretion protein, partial [Deltaproteobacteria bacterium]|nr:FHIPEP family type III secretion protein [Deltaproteobacteria bacterium]